MATYFVPCTDCDAFFTETAGSEPANCPQCGGTNIGSVASVVVYYAVRCTDCSETIRTTDTTEPTSCPECSGSNISTSTYEVMPSGYSVIHHVGRVHVSEISGDNHGVIRKVVDPIIQ
jgi:DNA-directed RNA polymerase subunit RPC12/RpoP